MRSRRGVVVEFDERRGYGTIAEDGGPRRFFHCTAIADGTRTIATGTTVRYRLVPGHLGRHQATDVHPAPEEEPARAHRGDRC